jgi:hypothetical protein
VSCSLHEPLKMTLPAALRLVQIRLRRHRNCLVHFKIARDARRLLEFAILVWTIPAPVVQIHIAIPATGASGRGERPQHSANSLKPGRYGRNCSAATPSRNDHTCRAGRGGLLGWSPHLTGERQLGRALGGGAGRPANGDGLPGIGVIIGLFSGWWTLAIIFGVLYGAAAIAGLFLVLVVGDVQAREDETYRASGWPRSTS